MKRQAFHTLARGHSWATGGGAPYAGLLETLGLQRPWTCPTTFTEDRTEAQESGRPLAILGFALFLPNSRLSLVSKRRESDKPRTLPKVIQGFRAFVQVLNVAGLGVHLNTAD